MKRTLHLAICLLPLAGCGHVEATAEEGKDAFQSGMRSKESAKDFAAQKESYDRQSDEF